MACHDSISDDRWSPYCKISGSDHTRTWPLVSGMACSNPTSPGWSSAFPGTPSGWKKIARLKIDDIHKIAIFSIYIVCIYIYLFTMIDCQWHKISHGDLLECSSTLETPQSIGFLMEKHTNFIQAMPSWPVILDGCCNDLWRSLLHLETVVSTGMRVFSTWHGASKGDWFVGS